MFLPLAQATRAECGAKAAHLAVLIKHGFRVPDGLVLPWRATAAASTGGYGPALTGGWLTDDIDAMLSDLRSPTCIVRSSALDEDGRAASAAGIYQTTIAAAETQAVYQAILDCVTTRHRAGPAAYRANRCAQPPNEPPSMSVIVQPMVKADAAGVMFTSAAAQPTARLEAAWGLGQSVVDGAVTPDVYQVASSQVVSCKVGAKHHRVDVAPDGRSVVTRPVEASAQLARCLSDPEAIALAELGDQAAELFGEPQDIEWAIAQGVIWLLQSRPITAPLLPATGQHVSKQESLRQSQTQSDGNDESATALSDELSSRQARDAQRRFQHSVQGGSAPVSIASQPAALIGQPAAAGVATGRARIVRTGADFQSVRPGDIIVCRHTGPSWVPLLTSAAGVVSETGGVLCHAAIVARECGIPAVVGVTDALENVPSGSSITIDGSSGTVTLSTTRNS